MHHTTRPQQAFYKAIESLMDCPPDCRTVLDKHLRIRTFSSRELLLTTDPFYQGLHVIYKGLARCYYHNAKGRETTAYFVWEGQFLPLNFSEELTLEFLEETILVGLAPDDLSLLYRQHPDLSLLPFHVARKQLARCEAWLRAFRQHTSGELLQWFLQEYPFLQGRIANKHLASFAGLAPESLSRIRARKK